MKLPFHIDLTDQVVVITGAGGVLVGIRCNAIAPGFFVSKQNEKLLFQEDGTPTAGTEKILRNTPMDRFGKEEELIGSLLFLASEAASSFVNGVVIPVDRGFSAYSGG